MQPSKRFFWRAKNHPKKELIWSTDIANQKIFEIGQLVWLKGIASATSPHRALKVQNLGPFKILQKSNDHTFFLARLSNPTKCDRIAHATHLEPYKCRVDMTPINFPSIAWNLN